MSIIRRIFGSRRGTPRPTAEKPDSQLEQLNELSGEIADTRVRLLELAARVSAGRGEPGDESRLRILRETLAGYQKRLDRMTLPTGTADDVEAWLRSITPRAATETRETDPL